MVFSLGTGWARRPGRLRFALTLALLVAGPGPLSARVPLFPNGGWTPGEFGALMAGAQVALASGAEAAWFNPAGMAKEVGDAWSLGGAGLKSSQAEMGEPGEKALTSHPANFSLIFSPGQTRRFTYGFFVARPMAREVAARFYDQQTTDQTALPEGLRGGVDLEGRFPGGIVRSEDSLGAGDLSVGRLGVGFGITLAAGFRAGGAVQWEQVHLFQRSDSLITFTAAEAPSEVLSGWVQTGTALQGVSDRLVYSLGFQAELAPGISLGFMMRLPSEPQGGRGDVQFFQAGNLNVASGGTVVLDNEQFTHIDQRGVAFQLRSPREARLGLAFVFDTLAVEFDLIQQAALEPYEVFPAVQSGPPSTAATRLGAWRTSLEATTGFAVGVAATTPGGGSYLFGLARESTGVPADDPIFRRVEIETLALGYAMPRGAFSASFGMVYHSGRALGAMVPPLQGGAPLAADITFEAIALVGGVSYLF